MIKFPYGMSDFQQIVSGGYFYCDRTAAITRLEQGRSQLFIRPRRFGKCLLPSMLENYYDVAREGAFGEIFGGLAIGADPTPIHNPTLCLYFFKQFQKGCEYPRRMLDANLPVDDAKLAYVAGLPGGSDLVVSLSEKGSRVVVADLADRFGLGEMLSDASKDRSLVVSFLYYFGVLTLAGEREDLKLLLKVPNLVMQGLYVDRVRRMMLPDPVTRDRGVLAAERVYTMGDIRALCAFVEVTHFSIRN